MPQNKNISRKHLSVLDIFEAFATKQAQIDFFFRYKWPTGFICPICGCREYYYLENRNEYLCKHCCHQTSLLAGTIMQDTKLPLIKWILMLYFLCDSKNGVSALELSRKVGIGYTSARLNSRKIKYAMEVRNDMYQLFECVEHDEVYLGAPTKNGKRGLGTDKQLIFTDIQILNNIYPGNLKFRLGESHTTIATLEALRKNVKEGATLKTDGKTSYPGLEPHYHVLAEVNDYKNNPDHMKWLNTVVSNLKSFIQGTYHGIEKKYLRFAVAEFEWRFNRRTRGTEILEAAMRTIMSAPVMTNHSLVSLFSA